MNAQDAVVSLRDTLAQLKNGYKISSLAEEQIVNALRETEEIGPAPSCPGPILAAILDACRVRGVVVPDGVTEEGIIEMVRLLSRPPNQIPVDYSHCLFERLMQFCQSVKFIPPPFAPAAGEYEKSLDTIAALENYVLGLQEKNESAQSDRQRAQLYENSLHDQLNEASAALALVTEQRDDAWRVISKLVQK